jgi:hypothetical protein
MTLNEQAIIDKSVDTQYIFRDPQIKSRLIKKDTDWYVAEFKDHHSDSQWLPFICGTAEWLGLTDRDKKWAIAK